MKIPFHTRLNCPNSYAVEEDFHLRCEVGNTICDGELYECCIACTGNFGKELELMQGLLRQEGEYT